MILSIFLTIGNITHAHEPLFAQLIDQVAKDYGSFYQFSSLGTPLLGSTLAGGMANSHFDLNFQMQWQNHYRNQFTDILSQNIDIYSELTQYPIAIPVYFFLSMGLLELNGTSTSAIWGNHCLRTLVLGAPQQGLFSWLLGGGRPDTHQPEWHLMRHHRAVSGHAFYGAIPLLNIAKQSGTPWIKVPFYMASILPGLARINLDKHYFSQAFLGWWLALCATNTVWRPDKVSNKSYEISIEAILVENRIHLGLVAKF